jgi:hypothetical protein
VIEQQEEIVKMSIVTTSINELLPILRLNDVTISQSVVTTENILEILNDTKNLKIDISFDIIQNITELDKSITDQEYYKYLEATVKLLNETGEFSNQTIILTNDNFKPVINKLVSFSNINSSYLDAVITVNINFDRFAQEFGITQDQLEIIRMLYSTPRQITYPIIRDNSVVLTFDDGSKSLNKDLRILDGLENFNPTFAANYNLFLNYFSDLFTTHNNNKTTSFFTFDLNTFLRDSSYFYQDALLAYEVTMTITYNYKIIDEIKLSNNSFISKNGITILHKNVSGLCLLSFTHDIAYEPDVFNASIKIQISNNDKTFTNYFDSLNNTGKFKNLYQTLIQIKNILLLAKRYTNPDQQPYYLDLASDKFTDEFKNFYNEKIVFFKKYNLDLTLSNFIRDTLILVYNRFSSNVIDNSQIQTIINSLSLENASYNVWVRAFKTFETIYDSINVLLLNTKTNSFFTKTKSFQVLIRKSNSFYSLSDVVTYETVPTEDYKSLKDNFIAERNFIYANYFNGIDEQYQIKNDIRINDESYNAISSYVNSKKNKTTNKNLLDFNNLGFGATLKEQKIEEKNNKTSLNKSLDTNIQTTINKNNKTVSNALKVKDVRVLNDSEKLLLSTKNSFILNLQNGIEISNITKDTVSPKLVVSKYNLTINQWETVLDINTIQDKDFIKLEAIDAPDLFELNDVEPDKLDLVNNYFIVSVTE